MGGRGDFPKTKSLLFRNIEHGRQNNAIRFCFLTGARNHPVNKQTKNQTLRDFIFVLVSQLDIGCILLQKGLEF